MAVHYVVCISLVAILSRWCISLNKYSGAGKSPMFGDYEAQRHWMEITYNLPVNEWYSNTTDNDLLYWGLDYPPLTAYHSWVCGYIADKIDPTWVALKTSRGFESDSHKLFMRYSVIVVDVLLYFTAVFLLSYHQNVSQTNKCSQSLMMLLYPGLMLIDHGHFQYNCVSLGLTLWSVYYMSKGRELLGSIAFVLALNYKQMELYHAFPFFFYLLGLCLMDKQKNGFVRLIKIGMTVIMTFILCWMPFLTSADSALHVINRLFPFSRGLYEDKVANVWCSLSVLVKLKNILSVDHLILVCLVSTLLLCLPSSLHLLLRPSVQNFKYSLINCSLAFFLFSFQVHEKSILIPAIIVNLVCIQHPLVNVWFSVISTFSMIPLLIKDGQLLTFIASTALYMVISFGSLQIFPLQSSKQPRWKSNVQQLFFALSMFGMVMLVAGSILVKSPPHLPDLWPVLISMYSCIHFLIFLIHFNVQQFKQSDYNSNLTPAHIKKRQ